MGFGKSVKTELSHFILYQIAFVNRFLEKLVIDESYNVVHTFGTSVASKYALNFSDRVKGLILVGPAGIRDEKFEDKCFLLRGFSNDKKKYNSF